MCRVGVGRFRCTDVKQRQSPDKPGFLHLVGSGILPRFEVSKVDMSRFRLSYHKHEKYEPLDIDIPKKSTLKSFASTLIQLPS